MKLKELYEKLGELMENDPETGDLEVITPADDEGNDFKTVYYDPEVGYWDNDQMYVSKTQLQNEPDDWDIEEGDLKTVVCIG